MTKTKSRIQKLTESTGLDILGVGIVLTASIALGFHKTVINDLPIGIMSVVGAVFSMMATRLVTKRKNIGNQHKMKFPRTRPGKYSTPVWSKSVQVPWRVIW